MDMFELGKKRIKPDETTSAFTDRMIEVAKSTFDRWEMASGQLVKPACGTEAMGRFPDLMEKTHHLQPKSHLYCAALVATQSASIPVCR
jgi:hypothetical protein